MTRNRIVGVVRGAIVGFGLTAMLAAGTFAQEATPTGEPVSPNECTKTARPLTFLADLIATPAPRQETISAWPVGKPADDEALAAFTAVARELTACSNTGDILRALALYSDDYLRGALDPVSALTQEEAIEQLAPFATPFAFAEDQLTRFVGVKYVTVLDDGRIAGVTMTDGGILDPDGYAEDLLIIQNTDTGWLIVDALASAESVLGPPPAQ
jgi:hypothetical protein